MICILLLFLIIIPFCPRLLLIIGCVPAPSARFLALYARFQSINARGLLAIVCLLASSARFLFINARLFAPSPRLPLLIGGFRTFGARFLAPSYNSVNATDAITTVLITNELATRMTITPPFAGKYKVTNIDQQ